MIPSDKEEEEEESVGSRSSLEDTLLSTPRQPPCCITVEPILLSIFFCISLTGSVTVNFLEVKTCLLEVPVSMSNCTEPFPPEVESLVQPKTAKLMMYISLLQALLPSLMSFFIGPWTDTNGRKPFLVISLAGYCCNYTLWSILAVIPGLNLYYFLLPACMIAASGGLVALFTCVNAYIGDISTSENRAIRFTLVTSSFMAGLMAGNLVSAKLFSNIGQDSYLIIYVTAAVICFISLMYTIFFVPETVVTRQSERQAFFNFIHVRTMARIVFQKRPRHGRTIILLMALILLFLMVIVEGETFVRYFALKKAFSWSLEQYNFFSAGSTLVCVLVSVTGISMLRRWLHIPDIIICFFSAVAWATSDLLLGLTASPLQFCLFSGLGTMATLIGPTLRSEMSKIVPQNDLGKVFAFDSTLESLSQYAATPLYTFVYTALLPTKPLQVYFLSAALGLCVVLLIFVIIVLEYCCGKPYYNLLSDDERVSNTINEDRERQL